MNWAPHRDPEADARFRTKAAATISAILAKHEGMPELEILLAISEACTCITRAEQAIWIEEVHRLAYSGSAREAGA